MNLRKATGRTVLVGLSAVLLLACGLSWAQKEDDKGKNEKNNNTHAASKPAPRNGSRPGTNNEGSRGGNANAERGPNNNERGATGGAGAGKVNRDNNVNGANNRPGNNVRPEGNNGRPEVNNGENRGATGGAGAGKIDNANRNPGGQPGGRPRETGSGNANAGARPNNGFGATHTVTRGGYTANVGAGGRVTTIHNNNITINNYGPRGGRTVVVNRPGGVRVVSVGGRAGWVDHPFVRGGAPWVTRTYIGFGGRPFASVYVGVGFRGFTFYHYVPAWRFAPAFYLWAWHPWAAPISFTWGWGPWYGHYGYYFRPYPAYASANLWLTDYIIAANLQAAYDAQQAAAANAAAGAYYPPPPPDPAAYSTPLSPELKQAIADEVAAQLAAQQQAPPAAAAGAPPPPAYQPNSVPGALDPKIRTFIVNAGMNETLANGTECPLAPGDVLTRIDDNPDGMGNVHVLVSSSQASDCASGSQILMSAQALQDMHNAFQQQVDNGLQQLSQSQGKNGIPMGPAANVTANPDGTAQPDASAANDLQQTDQQAQQAESQVQGAQ